MGFKIKKRRLTFSTKLRPKVAGKVSSSEAVNRLERIAK